MKETLHQMVRRFHQVAGVPIKTRPEVPSDERVRLRLDMIAEEFFELLEASLDLRSRDGFPTQRDMFEAAKVRIKAKIQTLPIRVNLPEFADALADMDVINEGTRLEFGIFGQDVVKEVHRANMRKFPRCNECDGTGRVEKKDATVKEECKACLGAGYKVVRREDGKILKPEGWTPPNIEHVLLEQGWKPLEWKSGQCKHGVMFDVEQAKAIMAEVREVNKGRSSIEVAALMVQEIRNRFPRLHGRCPLGCGFEGICYASTDHYVFGDWCDEHT